LSKLIFKAAEITGKLQTGDLHNLLVLILCLSFLSDADTPELHERETFSECQRNKVTPRAGFSLADAANIPEAVAARKLSPHVNVLHLLEQH
jgi:hypothetical protein